jgi:hypothetical protein
VDVSFPDDPYLRPFVSQVELPAPLDSKGLAIVTADLLANARLITDPGERSLALEKLARGAIKSNQLLVAHNVMEEAISATAQVTVPLVRDQRLQALVSSMTLLTDELLQPGNEIRNVPETTLQPEATPPAALPKRMDAKGFIRLAQLEWRRAAYLASLIGNPTYRNEMLAHVAENESKGSITLVNQYIEKTDTEPAPGPASPSPKAGSARPAASPAKASSSANDGKEKAEYAKLADEILVNSWEVAKKIDRLIWKYRAMVRISLAATDSKQFARGVELVRGIENAESRTEALLPLAEGQSRQGDIAAATATYQVAAEAAASIPQDGLRGVMTGYLVDSLISVGHFDDARACTVIYPLESERFVALGAIAESMGKRGAADKARQWIATDVPEAYRAALYRRVTAGQLWALDLNRTKEPGSELPRSAR